MNRLLNLAVIFLAVGVLTSCKTLSVSSVTYQSVRTEFAKPDSIPGNATLGVEYFFDATGQMLVVVYNLTDEVITIDQTKSFLVNTNGVSTSYYDPTIHSTTVGGSESTTSGASFNLGAISSIFGIGGPLGSLMNGTTLNGSNTISSFHANTVTVQDQPTVRIGPRGQIVMSKQFQIIGIGEGSSNSSANNSYIDTRYSVAPLRFSVTICYNVEGHEEFSNKHLESTQKLITNFYVNTSLTKNVAKGRVSDAFTAIYKEKSDALAEPAYIFYVSTNISKKEIIPRPWEDLYYNEIVRNKYMRGSLIDYK